MRPKIGLRDRTGWLIDYIYLPKRSQQYDTYIKQQRQAASEAQVATNAGCLYNLNNIQVYKGKNEWSKQVDGSIVFTRWHQCALICWRHLANTTELLLPSAHPSPQPRRQIDRFSRFWATVCKRPYIIKTSVLSVCLSVVLVYCGQTVEWIKM